jgi:hypothetical protein
MPTYELVAGDRGSKLRVTLLDSVTEEALDLSGKTVQLRYSLNGGATVEKSMTVLNQATNKGQAEYQFAAADLTEGGELRGEVRVQDGFADQITSVDSIFLSVKTPLPEPV